MGRVITENACLFHQCLCVFSVKKDGRSFRHKSYCELSTRLNVNCNKTRSDSYTMPTDFLERKKYLRASLARLFKIYLHKKFLFNLYFNERQQQDMRRLYISGSRLFISPFQLYFFISIQIKEDAKTMYLFVGIRLLEKVQNKMFILTAMNYSLFN